jgi:hypothetical protein
MDEERLANLQSTGHLQLTPEQMARMERYARERERVSKQYARERENIRRFRSFGDGSSNIFSSNTSATRFGRYTMEQSDDLCPKWTKEPKNYGKEDDE